MSSRDGRAGQRPGDLDVVKAELEAHGEDIGEGLEEELEAATALSRALDEDPDAWGAQTGLRVLQEAAHGALNPSKAAELYDALRDTLSERDEISAELQRLGEEPLGAEELSEGEALGQLSARLLGDAETTGQPQASQKDNKMLEVLISASPSGTLTETRSAELLSAVTSKLNSGGDVIDLNKRRAARARIGRYLAAAAVVLVCISGGMFASMMGGVADQASLPEDVTRVEQFELKRAESGAQAAEREALVALTGTVAEGTASDAIRRLRYARHDLIRARVQARERRL